MPHVCHPSTPGAHPEHDNKEHMLLAAHIAMLVGVLAAYLRMLAGATQGAASLEDSLAHNVIHGLTNGETTSTINGILKKREHLIQKRKWCNLINFDYYFVRFVCVTSTTSSTTSVSGYTPTQEEGT